MDNIPNDRIQQFYNGYNGFRVGDTVRNNQWSGTVVGFVQNGNKMLYRVVGMDGETERQFEYDDLDKIEFDSNQESNRYLEKLIKERKNIKMKTNTPVHKPTVDELLDAYNNNKEMYETTGIEDFKRGMDEIMGRLKEVSKKK